MGALQQVDLPAAVQSQVPATCRPVPSFEGQNLAICLPDSTSLPYPSSDDSRETPTSRQQPRRAATEGTLPHTHSDDRHETPTSRQQTRRSATEGPLPQGAAGTDPIVTQSKDRAPRHSGDEVTTIKIR